MSIRTTSGCRSVASETASSPVAASPTSSVSTAEPSSARNPSRKSMWSSAISPRVSVGRQADSIVDDREMQGAIYGKLDSAGARLGVSDDIRERLLYDAVGSHLHRRWKRRQAFGCLDSHDELASPPGGRCVLSGGLTNGAQKA